MKSSTQENKSRKILHKYTLLARWLLLHNSHIYESPCVASVTIYLTRCGANPQTNALVLFDIREGKEDFIRGVDMQLFCPEAKGSI